MSLKGCAHGSKVRSEIGCASVSIVRCLSLKEGTVRLNAGLVWVLLMLLGSQVPSDKNAVNARKIRKNGCRYGREVGLGIPGPSDALGTPR